MGVIVRQVVLVEQLDQLKCLLVLVDDHSAKVGGQFRGTKQYDFLLVRHAHFGKVFCYFL